MSLLNKEKMLEVAKQFVDEGRFDRAVKEYEKIIMAEPQDLRVRITLAELQVRRKKIVEAIAIYREIAEKYEAEGFYLKAVTIYKNIIKLNPSLIEINERLAVLYHKMGLIADAIRQYEILAVSLEQLGSWDEILEVRRKIVDLKPEDGGARVRLAEIYQRQGMIEDAIDQYEAYATQLEKTGDEKRMLDMYEKILPYRQKNHDMLKKVIELSYKLGDVKKALKWLENAKELADSDETLLELKAKIYTSFNQLETARNHYLMLADLLTAKGNKEKAVRVYEEVLYIDPSEEENIKDKVKAISSEEWKKVKEKVFERRKKDEEESESEEETKSGSTPVVQEKVEKKEIVEEPKNIIKESVVKIEIPKKPVIDEQAVLKGVDSSISLASTYFKMGLVDEAKTEFLSAKEKIASLLGVNPALRGKIVEIEKFIKQCDSGKAFDKTEPVVQKKSIQKEKTIKENSISSDKTKKKISFV